MASRMVTNREKAVREVASAAREHAGRAAESIAARLAQELREGETVPNVPLFLELLSRLLARQADQLAASDEGHLGERGLRSDIRSRRIAALSAVRKALIDIRIAFDGAYGDGATAKVFNLETVIGRDSQLALRQALRVLARLDEGLPPLPPLRVAGFEGNPLEWTSTLRPAAQELGRILEEAATTKRHTQALLSVKHERLEKFDSAYAQTAQMVEAFFKFAEMPDQARQVRPRARRTLGRPAEEQPVPALAAEPPATLS